MSRNKLTETSQLLILKSQFVPILYHWIVPITWWHLNKKLKMTLPTHPYRKTFRFIQLLTPVNSTETLPLKGIKMNSWASLQREKKIRWFKQLLWRVYTQLPDSSLNKSVALIATELARAKCRVLTNYKFSWDRPVVGTHIYWLWGVPLCSIVQDAS